MTLPSYCFTGNSMFRTIRVFPNIAQTLEILHEIWPFDSQENHLICCHQMSDFKAKMHQIQFRVGLLPSPAMGAYRAPPDPYSWI